MKTVIDKRRDQQKGFLITIACSCMVSLRRRPAVFENTACRLLRRHTDADAPALRVAGNGLIRLPGCRLATGQRSACSTIPRRIAKRTVAGIPVRRATTTRLASRFARQCLAIMVAAAHRQLTSRPVESASPTNVSSGPTYCVSTPRSYGQSWPAQVTAPQSVLVWPVVPPSTATIYRPMGVGHDNRIAELLE